MVNYCCVAGCGRNNRSSKQLNYYSVPKERPRQVEWFEAAGRQDLLEKSQEKLGYRFCSRHFEPNNVKNKHLKPDAVPTLNLPGCKTENDYIVLQHVDVACDNCKEPIVGFRYKCLVCPDYDLCSQCETVEAHPEHYMLRISRPDQNAITEQLLQKWKGVFQSESLGDVSSDDEPITKYARNYDSGVDLSEDLKDKIRREVTRALSAKKKKRVKTTKKRDAEINKPMKKRRKVAECDARGCPEVVFVSARAPDAEHDVKAELDTEREAEAEHDTSTCNINTANITNNMQASGVTSHISGSITPNMNSSNIIAASMSSSNIITPNMNSSNIITTNVSSSNIIAASMSSSNIIAASMRSSNIDGSSMETSNIDMVQETVTQEPVAHMKISEDFSDLMIEMPGQQALYIINRNF